MAVGHLFRRLYLRFLVWRCTRNFHIEGIRVFQACSCGELYTVMATSLSTSLACKLSMVGRCPTPALTGRVPEYQG